MNIDNPANAYQYRFVHKTDSLGRPAGLALDGTAGAPPAYDIDYAFDAANRLKSVLSASTSHSYGYGPGSDLVTSLVHSNATGQLLQSVTTRGPDGRVESLDHFGGGLPLASFGYVHDDLQRRVQIHREDGTYWQYGYDSRS